MAELIRRMADNGSCHCLKQQCQHRHWLLFVRFDTSSSSCRLMEHICSQPTLHWPCGIGPGRDLSTSNQKVQVAPPVSPVQ